MTNRPGVLLDRDGTIIVDYHYVGHIERVQFIPGAIEAIRRFNQHDIPVALVTNQSGVARGFYPESNVDKVHDYMLRELNLHGAYIDYIAYSPHHPDGSVKEYAIKHEDHKPGQGMARRVARALGLDLHESWVVGDRFSDMEFASRIRASAVYLGTEPLPYYMSHFHPFNSLADAAGFIIERITGMNQIEFPDKYYTGAINFFDDYTREINEVSLHIDRSKLVMIGELLQRAYDDHSNVFVAGNGGAAAIASHFLCDHLNFISQDGYVQPNVRDLTSDTALITAIANDIGYDAIFSSQIERLATHFDFLMVFSVSGNSANIIRAIQCAREMSITTIAIVACDGGKAAGMADVTLHIPTGNYGIAEDIMQTIMHSLAQYIRQSRMNDGEIKSARF